MVFAIAKLLLAYGVGFALPGYSLARLLRVGPVWCGSFVLSWLTLVLGVILFQILGWPITFGAILCWQLAVTIGGGTLWFYQPKLAPNIIEPAEENDLSRQQRGILLGCILLMGAMFAVRVAMSPLTGFDTPFRWDFLARQMLIHHSLDFYPPMSGADYRIYFFPDGIAPVVCAAYWWIYAAWGKADPTLTAPFVLAQWAAVIGFTWQLARSLGGRSAGWFAAATAAGSAFLFRGVAIGQETGAIAVAIMGMLSALILAKRQQWRGAVAAGLFAGLAAMAREYGAIFILVGLLPAGILGIRWPGRGGRVLFVFLTTAAMIAAPWYLRNLVRCGNPFHTLTLIGFPPAAPVYARMLETYQSTFSPWKYSPQLWRSLLLELLQAMPLAMTVGLLAGIVFIRRAGVVLLAMVLLVGVWWSSVKYTSGGLIYSARVLCAVAALSAVPVGLVAAKMAQSSARRWAVTAVLSLAVLWGMCLAASFPINLPMSEMAKVPRVFLTRYRMSMGDPKFLEMVEKQLPGGARILADNAYTHALLRPAGFDVVPIWSPDVAFVFDGATTGQQARQKLRALGIGYVLVSHQSVNRVYCSAHPLYRDDLRNWHAVIDQDGLILFELPQ